MDNEVGARDLEPMLKNLLAELLKPSRVRGLVFTHSCGCAVQGIALTSPPNERRTLARDFEVRFAGPSSSRITSVSVKGEKPVRLKIRKGFSGWEEKQRGKKTPGRGQPRIAMRSACFA